MPEASDGRAAGVGDPRQSSNAQRYHLKHNFGHGHHHLAITLLTLNVLAFLFHNVLPLVDASYQRIRQQRGTRKGFFQNLQTLTKYLFFDSWQHLIDFMLDEPTPATMGNTSSLLMN